SPRCTQEQFDRGECKVLCPTGDCYTPLQADDASSKFYQAKEALYEVMQKVDDIHFGFSTYNQDALSVRAKHWLYEATTAGVTVPGWGAFPPVGAQEVFGLTWSCDTGQNDNEIGCTAGKPADLTDVWERTRMQRFAKGGLDRTATTDFYIRHAGTTYRARYRIASGTYGADLDVNVTVSRCNNGSCSNNTEVGTQTVRFRAISDFLSWDNAADNNPSRTNPQLEYFDTAASDSAAGNTCAGWDPNDDTTSDRSNGYSLRFPTDISDGRGAAFHTGDVVPLDWKVDHREDILRRLAPNLALDASATPDFRIATYFKDDRGGSEAFLRLKSEPARPFLAQGSTPLGNSVRSFRTWYAGCPQGTCPKGTGWKSTAAAQDPDWGCRRKFLLVITDGDDTCGGADACAGTASLFAQEGIKTYVVAFGVQNTSGNKLTCMAANGGSGKPIYPQNKDELVTALTDIFGQIREEASAFASAAVPSVQAEVADRIYLSSFTPLNLQPVWDGHLDAYLKPLPLTADGKPDQGRACPAPGSPGRSSCHLWDAGEVLVTQAPTQADLSAAAGLDEAVLKLGLGEQERRVFYGKAGFGGATPVDLRLFSPPAGDPRTDPEWTDLWAGLKIPLPTTDAGRTVAKDRAEDVIAKTLVVKNATVDRLSGAPEDVEYILGDIFHSDPVIVDRPNDFTLYTANLYGDPSSADCTASSGYRCFADKHRRRRKMLLVGSNDGQLHVFDGGIWDSGDQKFTDGTGRELFSYIPRIGLPIVRELAEQSGQMFGVDGTPRIDDVFIDPEHNGTPNAAEREWRSLAIGGFREGGSRDSGGRLADFVSGYYALDLTQPDRLESDGDPVDERVVPGCLTTQNQTVTGCGTLPFPSVAWEFTDSITTSRLDEDANGYPDLGQTWSVPTVGRIRVVENGKAADKFVAIFGGGMDADSKPSPKRGNWLYMVDIETGRALYKRPLVGAAPSDPAVLDVDLDGYLDTIYIGTISGFLYKADISSPALVQTVTINRDLALPPLAADQQVPRITDTSWDPFPIFDTVGKPIYFAPTAFFVASLDRFALAFGTGDREDLWAFNGQEGRFYMIIDEGFTLGQTATGVLPRDESDYEEVDTSGATAAEEADFVMRPEAGKQRGWYLRLEPDERIITQGFGLSGIVIFSSFQPQIVVSGSSGSGSGNGAAGRADAVCARGGDSRIFVVLATNANPLTSGGRFRLVPEFVTNPYVEQGSTKNPPGSGDTRDTEDLDAVQQEIMKALKKLAPKDCKFANYWISVSGIRSDTGYERYATIPICGIRRNWKEH
ncbi:MAG TPA: hypothetical protein VLT87_17155, partial [Thermoanaerobaculia bacterium]|nr:hypothetical protein [Thermoanaerobaculia bacterium]